ncbi:glycosyltransferase [uncultured Cytophaga sp.]|uniref:glycosyltransferase n=1 Tax=uncultured Cytophaga sp. TaxID=160238 RepID=UPI00263782B9|nr:glycosyltransferase [uncultured Cytophaga sp.]
MNQENGIKNIAVFGSHISWDGGVDFLCYLVQSLKTSKEATAINIFLILPYPFISRIKNFLLLLKLANKNPSILWDKNTQLFENKNNKLIRGFSVNNIPVKIIYYNYSQKDLAKKLNVIEADVIFPSILTFGKSFPTPWVGYIPDLQHKHFPENFTKEECASRDTKYKHLLNESKSLFVNSLAARNDLMHFYSSNGGNIFSLPFCPPAPIIEISETLAESIKQKYNLTKPFFIISNQFWKHKSHITAFKALAALLNDGFTNIEIICTGKPFDDKDPGFIDSLMQEIKALQIENAIKFTGFISKNDQLILMSLSVALIQPTLFEGGPGGGSVYNAVSYGTPCIVSDIDINKEVQGENIYFFKASDSIDLKNNMKLLLQKKYSKKSFFDLVKEGDERTKRLGITLKNIFQKAIQ